MRKRGSGSREQGTIALGDRVEVFDAEVAALQRSVRQLIEVWPQCARA